MKRDAQLLGNAASATGDGREVTTALTGARTQNTGARTLLCLPSSLHPAASITTATQFSSSELLGLD